MNFPRLIGFVLVASSLCPTARPQMGNESGFESNLNQSDSRKAKDFSACPLGHARLKDLPTIYGAYSKEARRKVARLEAWDGGAGCTFQQATTVVCTQCRFSYSSLLRSWEKSSPSPRDFSPRISGFLTEIPLLRSARGDDEPSFRQVVRDETWLDESVRFYSEQDHTKLAGALKAYLEPHAPDLQSRRKTSSSGGDVTAFSGHHNGTFFVCRIEYVTYLKKNWIELHRGDPHHLRYLLLF